LQPIRKCGYRYCKIFAKFFVGKNCESIGAVIGKYRLIVGIGFV